jgi:hypothetical protein
MGPLNATMLTTERWWKGSRAPTVTVWELDVCGRGFELGQRYLVFATAEGGRLHTNACLLTAPLPPNTDAAALAYWNPNFAPGDSALGPSLPPLSAITLPERMRRREQPSPAPLTGVARPVFTGWRPVAYAAAAVLAALVAGVWWGHHRKAA